MYCTECGAEIYEGDVFCRNCRARVDQPGATQDTATPTPETIATPVPGTGSNAQPQAEPAATILDSQETPNATVIDTAAAAGAAVAGAAAAGSAAATPGASAQGSGAFGSNPFATPIPDPARANQTGSNMGHTQITDLDGYTAPEQPGAGASSSSSNPNMKKWLPFIILGVVLLIVIVIVVMIMTSGSNTQQAGTNTATTAASGVTANLKAGDVVSEQDIKRNGMDSYFTISEIDNALYKRIKGVSYSKKSPVQRDNLRYIRCLHKNEQGQTLVGEIIVAEKVADDVRNIFKELYEAGFPIQSMRLPEDFGGDNDQSMRENNTTGYCYRKVTDSNELSSHAYGESIDVNPLYNPFWRKKTGMVYPPEGKQYLDRNASFPYKITPDGICVKTFAKYGFTWHGNNPERPDYQHFQKEW